MLTAAAWRTLSRTAVLNKSVATFRLTSSLAAGTCRRQQRRCTDMQLSSTVEPAEGRQGKSTAHYHSIVHRKRAGFWAQLPRSWSTADRNRMQSRNDPRNAQEPFERTKRNTKKSSKGQQKYSQKSKMYKNTKTLKPVANPNKR
jgi:hypothetical protein